MSTPIKEKSANANEIAQIARLLTRYVTSINQSTPSINQSSETISRPNPPTLPSTTPPTPMTPTPGDYPILLAQKPPSRNLLPSPPPLPSATEM